MYIFKYVYVSQIVYIDQQYMYIYIYIREISIQICQVRNSTKLLMRKQVQIFSTPVVQNNLMPWF